MGILGLQTFALKSCQNVVQDVNIIQCAAEYQKKTGRTPILVIDGSACISLAYRPGVQMHLPGGGILKECAHTFVTMLEDLQRANIKPVVFFDGMTPDIRADVFKRRSYERMDRTKLLMQRFTNGHFSVLDAQQDFNLGSLATSEFFVQVQLQARGIEYREAIKEADDEIMEYIAEHGCFGVLTGDSDFLIAEGIPYFFFSQSLRLRTMDCQLFSQKQLAVELGVHCWQLPMLATLCGNDVVTRSMLRDFHTTLLQNLCAFNVFAEREFFPSFALFPAVAAWMKRSLSEHWSADNLPEVAAGLMGSPHLAHLFRQSISSYLLPTKPTKTHVGMSLPAA